MKKHVPILFGTLFLLAACQTSEVLDMESGQTPQAGNEQVSDLIAKECAVYFAIEDQLEAEGRPASGKIYEGCPPSASVGADIKALSPVPTINDPKAKTFYRKMIARGAPKDIA